MRGVRDTGIPGYQCSTQPPLRGGIAPPWNKNAPPWKIQGGALAPPWKIQGGALAPPWQIQGGAKGPPWKIQGGPLAKGNFKIFIFLVTNIKFHFIVIINYKNISLLYPIDTNYILWMFKFLTLLKIGPPCENQGGALAPPCKNQGGALAMAPPWAERRVVHWCQLNIIRKYFYNLL